MEYHPLVQQSSNKMGHNSNNDGVSIELKNLANSLRGEFKSLYPLTEDCCIYRVPPKIRMLDESLYTPKIVSIGPLHHGREELKAMEEHKLRYLQQFLDQTSVRMEDFLKFIKDKEVELRNYYGETLQLKSEDFVKMILLDAMFLIGILLRYIPPFRIVDRIFTNPGMIKDVVLDIMLLENQLPIFIVKDLFNKANLVMPDEKYTLSLFARAFFESYICKGILIDEDLLEPNFSNAKHFVDLIILCLKPPIRGDTDTKREVDSEDVPNVTILHQSGVKFELAKTKNLFDITFRKGILTIPKLTISNITVHLLRNLQIYEAMHCDTNYMNDYNVIINRLLSTSKDVELLVKKGVLENRILDSEGVSSLFQELSRDVRIQHNQFYYSSLVKDLKSYCKVGHHRWVASLKQNHCYNPWIIISVIAACIILILTLIQTICSILGLKKN